MKKALLALAVTVAVLQFGDRSKAQTPVCVTNNVTYQQGATLTQTMPNGSYSGWLTARKAEGWALVKFSKFKGSTTATIVCNGIAPPPPVTPPTSTPPPSSGRGPQASITCPSGAVDIWPGSSIQLILNSWPGNTAFCLRAGTHYLTASIIPKTGDSFTGEYGAILDGTGWVTSDLDAAAFEALDNGITRVTIRNLVIRNMPSFGINAYLSALSWIVDHDEIAGCRTGVSVGHYSQITNSFIHHNVGVDNDPMPAKRGGGYSISQTVGVLFDHNEVSYNGTEQKFIGSPRGTDNTTYTISNNYVHHNRGNGIWNDGYGAGGKILNNISSYNGANGIILEKGKSIAVTGNTTDGNAQTGVSIQGTRDSTVANNTSRDNNIGIDFFIDLADKGTSAWSIDLRDNAVTGNIITVRNNPGTSFAVVLSHTGAGDVTPYASNTANNTVTNTTYTVPAGYSAWWYWEASKSWEQWRAIPQDAGSTVSVP